jgi:3-oxoacyl-[acyl-carrier-protein] synthase III
MDELLAASLATARFNTQLLTTLGLIALLLASVGVYGVVAYFVSQRTQEIGLRMALGATPGHVWRLVLRRGLAPIVWGVAAGAAMSLATARLLRGQLYGVEAKDPLTLVGVALLLLAVSVVATYVPDRIVTNADLSQRLDTSDEWIVTRTGIRERRAGAPGETTASMGAEAVRRLMAERSLGPGDIEALIVATVTPDMVFPATACLIQDRLGLPQAWGYDLSAACSGFLYALTSGAQLLASGVHRKVVVVGADLMSSIIDPIDRTTAVLFGDGAGAVLLEPAEPGFGVLDFVPRVDGSGADDLYMLAGGSRRPLPGGLIPAEQNRAVEFGGGRERQRTYSTRSRRGKRYQVTRHTQRQLPPFRRSGYVFYPAVAKITPRIAALWAQTWARGIHEVMEGKRG